MWNSLKQATRHMTPGLTSNVVADPTLAHTYSLVVRRSKVLHVVPIKVFPWFALVIASWKAVVVHRT
ncbi:hypothetical protein Pmani_013222 [Petrolisthes manimaculis]|uniref:Uncharacterized protein n=1 Tax=Petrolisthes manimaculis TaxID=1843537 RepID=A0AAE1UE87_9EUCA|nr:hypothetical protein Pmani_013222 [Petrolisthes manimaculis]